jgi:endo-1,4-beta-mannosidase
MPTRKGGPRPSRRVTPDAAAARENLARATETGAEAEAAGDARADDVAAAIERGKLRRNPDFPLGVDLPAIDEEARGAQGWYARDLEDDLAALAAARITLVRFYLSWRLAEPQVGQYDEDVLGRVAELLDACQRHKLRAVLVFFGDDRHSELSEVMWGTRRDPRTDGYLIQREAAFIQKVVGKVRSHPAVFAWQLADEAFCSGFESGEELETWAEQLRDAVRELDPDRPLALGCDAETLARATGLDGRETLASFEFSLSHSSSAYKAYAAPGPITSGPPTWLDGFLLRLSQRGWPVLADGVGVQSMGFSMAEEAAHVRSACWSSLLNRGAGVMARRYRDLVTERREPYFVDPYETLVGIADSDGDPKPAFNELAAFARLVARIDLANSEAVPERVAVVMPTERFRPLPDLAGLFVPRSCFSAYVTCKQAHLPVTVAYEDDDLDVFSVLVIPSVFSLAGSTWERIAAFVQGGGSVVYSFGGGDAPPVVRELFGVEFLGDEGPRESLSCRVAQGDVLGPLTSFDARIELPGFASLSAVTATVVATDEKGSPLLTLNQVGQGRAVFVAVPLERAIAQGDVRRVPSAIGEFQRTYLAAVAGSAGCGAPVACDHPDVEVAVRTGERELVLLLNHAPESVTATLTTERVVATISDVRGGDPIAVGQTTFGVPLGANSGAALLLEYR